MAVNASGCRSVVVGPIGLERRPIPPCSLLRHSKGLDERAGRRTGQGSLFRDVDYDDARLYGSWVGFPWTRGHGPAHRPCPGHAVHKGVCNDPVRSALSVKGPMLYGDTWDETDMHSQTKCV